MNVRGTALAVAAGLLPLVAMGAPPSLAASDPDPDPQGVVVTVPLLPYEPRADSFRVGPYTSRLDVLANDAGNPDRTRLELLDRHGHPVVFLVLRSVGRLFVEDGYVVLEPFENAKGHGTFSYRAASPNGYLKAGRAVVTMLSPVIKVVRDSAQTRRGVAVTLDVAANDQVMVPEAEPVCGPQLFAQRPPPVDPRPVILPDPERLPFPCDALTAGQQGFGTVLVTPEGRWEVDTIGRVVFAPTAGFHGTARAYYRQAADNPFDLGVAGLRVIVRLPGDTRVLGVSEGKPDKPSPATPGAVRGGGSGSAGSPLPRTGADIAAAGVLGTGLVIVGSALVRAGRRRRQAQALDE